MTRKLSNSDSLPPLPDKRHDVEHEHYEEGECHSEEVREVLKSIEKKCARGKKRIDMIDKAKRKVKEYGPFPDREPFLFSPHNKNYEN